MPFEKAFKVSGFKIPLSYVQKNFKEKQRLRKKKCFITSHRSVIVLKRIQRNNFQN